jgi:hypothetical protein
MKVEFEDVLWTKVKKHAASAGYSSAEEFVQHAVDKQLQNVPLADDSHGASTIKGIGYLDAGRDI